MMSMAFPLVREGRIAGYNRERAPAGEHRDNVFGDAVGEILLLRPLILANGSTAIDDLSGSARAGVFGAVADTELVATL